MKKLINLVFVGFVGLTSFAAPTVTDVVAKQRYPWGVVDISCKVSGIDEEATKRFGFIVSAVIPNMGLTNWLSHVWIIKEGDKTRDLSVSANGEYRLLWDAKADLGEVRYTNMVVRVIVDRENVQLWEGGPYWATTNVGAEKPQDCGYRFWWGDTVGYKPVMNNKFANDWVASDGSNLNFSFDSSNTPTYGKGIWTLIRTGWLTAEGVLAPKHDAAHAHWGGDWRMPTKRELDDLNSKCDWTRTSAGYTVRGRGEYVTNSIVLPYAGEVCETSIYGSNGCHYWSSEPHSYDGDRSWGWSMGMGIRYRNYGRCVRPVQGFTK